MYLVDTGMQHRGIDTEWPRHEGGRVARVSVPVRYFWGKKQKSEHTEWGLCFVNE